MANRIKTAKQILEEKNYVQKKFDTIGFNDLVAKYFSENDVSATLRVVPLRFVELDDAPDCGFIDRTSPDYWDRAFHEGKIEYSELLSAIKKGLTTPSVAVDEPFCKNAVYMLSVMGGYIVKKKRGGRYVLSLL